MKYIYEELKNKRKKLAVIGLGYVGLPLAVAFSKYVDVIGFDINEEKITLLKSGIDPTLEVGDEVVSKCGVLYTDDEYELKESSFFIVAVPTPINQDKTPDLSSIIVVTELLARNISKNAIVVYESTVYPGVTEEVCIPILEEGSGLKCGKDFKIGYSPERINPGDKVHRLENIKKIVSGMDYESLEEIKKIYDLIIDAGTYPVSSIKTAEAIKVVENSQRDINIAFMNEMAMVFDKMGIDTNEVVDGMDTKWNALGFRPGLVGGHCIGVDPYYFMYKAENIGYHSQIVAAGRKVNDSMGKYVADAAIKEMILAGQSPKDSKVVILGLTFKENCADIRNSKVFDIILRLNEFGINPDIVDPWVCDIVTYSHHNISMKDFSEISDIDCLIVAVAHDTFKNIKSKTILKLFKMKSNIQNVLIDVKGIYNRKEFCDTSMRLWRL